MLCKTFNMQETLKAEGVTTDLEETSDSCMQLLLLDIFHSYAAGVNYEFILLLKLKIHVAHE